MADIRYLDIVCDIVEPLLKQFVDTGDSEIYKKVGRHYAKMSKGFEAEGEVDLEYRNKLNRLAYAYGYMGANASLVESVFTHEEQLTKYFDEVHYRNGKVRVCVFGAGPGTEMLGVAGWLLRRDLVDERNVDFSLFEIVNGWNLSFEIVRKALERKLRTTSITITPTCYYGSQANLTDFQLYDQASNHDIYIFSYILSEIRSKDGAMRLQNFGKVLTHGTPHNAKVIFLDRYKDKELTFKNICAITKGMDISKRPWKLWYELVPDGLLPQEWEVASGTRVENLRNQIGMMPRGSSKTSRNAIYAIVTKEE